MTCVEFFPFVIAFDKNDLMSLDRHHEKWIKILKYTEIK